MQGRVGHRDGEKVGERRMEDSDGRQVEKRRDDGGVNGGMRVERRENKWGRAVVGGNRLSCSPGKGDLFVSVGLCYSPDVSIIGLWSR